MHFPISMKDIRSRPDRGDKYTVDLDESKIRFKRAMSTHIQDTKFSLSECADSEISDADLEISRKHKVDTCGRGKEFLAALKGITDGSLDIHNIALHFIVSQGFVMSRCDFL